MKHRVHHWHISNREPLYIYLNGKLILTLKNYKNMATLSIDIEDNAVDLTTLVADFQTAYTALKGATISNLAQALTDLDTAETALAAFQITFTASVPPAA